MLPDRCHVSLAGMGGYPTASDGLDVYGKALLDGRMALCSARASRAQTGVLSDQSPPTSDMLLLTYTGSQPDLVQGLRGFMP